MNKLEEFGRTNSLLSFVTTRTAQKEKKLGGTHRQSGDLKSLLKTNGEIQNQTAKVISKVPKLSNDELNRQTAR
jgi:hypothetical protein